ncbi:MULTISPECIES: ATP-binding protein [Actinotignum]|uniref:ATP-binding protein n=1 Tax=Actinotignum TaxID=1653174 RepID=UPI00254EEB6C|nr:MULTISPECIES: ATP-binding protein [Actinotignum]MDE1535888.1 ATP-binding protein [Actinotignum schaalii]MDK7271656.1 ATP-binding protein [Actinotignum schaalii]MDY5130445.1 ATP-binding protein [Actinotignum timonense]MDY5144228.1 ATP-binding protein [Actinotignum timonense]
MRIPTTSEETGRLIEGFRQQGRDSQHIEVKAAAHGLPKSIVETLSAFSNGSGGLIVLGLDEARGFTPVPKFPAARIYDALAGVCSDSLTPPVRADIAMVPYGDTTDGDTTLVMATIPPLQPRDKPCYVTARNVYGGSYIRTGDGDRKLSAYEIDRLLENKTQPHWDTDLVEEAGLDSLDQDLLHAVLERERLNHPRIFGKLPDETAMEQLRIIGTGPDGQRHPTLAGLLCLGTYPQEFFPRLTVTYAVYPGSTKASSLSGQRHLDSGTLAGPIPALVADGVGVVAKNMRVGGVVRGAFRHDLVDYPLVAVREALTNALMHRDYSPVARGTQVQLNLYADRLEVINPGGLFGTVTIDSLGTTGLSSTRNQFLARLLESTPFEEGGFVAENRGSGYQEIMTQLEREMLPPARPVDRLDSFSLTFERRRMTPAEQGAAAGTSSRERVLDYLRTHASATSRELAGAAGISLGGTRAVLNTLVTEGQVQRTEPKTSPKQRYRLAQPGA